MRDALVPGPVADPAGDIQVVDRCVGGWSSDVLVVNWLNPFSDS